MPAYIVLVNFTEQGIRNVRDTVKRAGAIKEALARAGGRHIGTWWTLGQYDIVSIVEAPDDETATRLILSIGMQGNARTTTLKAFSEEEMGRIVQGL